MKKIALFLTVVFCLGLTGCNKDAEVEAFIAENSAVIKEIVSKVEANPTEAGVDEAQKAFDAKKAGLKTKWEAIKDAREVQVSKDVKKKLDDTVLADVKKLTDVVQKLSDQEAVDKFKKLFESYQDIIKM
jgi:predicted metal-dependent hydrolase